MATTEIFQDWDSPYENLSAMRTTTRKTTTTTTTRLEVRHGRGIFPLGRDFHVLGGLVVRSRSSLFHPRLPLWMCYGLCSAPFHLNPSNVGYRARGLSSLLIESFFGFGELSLEIFSSPG